MVNIEDPKACWNFSGYKNEDGYGIVYVNSKRVRAHRCAKELSLNKNIPDGKLVLHKCDNPSCCNPSHLYIGNYSDNNSDRAMRNPTNQGDQGKLYSREIWLIRKLKIVKFTRTVTRYKYSEAYVAKMFKVSQFTIHEIWKDSKHLCKEGYYC